MYTIQWQSINELYFSQDQSGPSHMANEKTLLLHYKEEPQATLLL